MRRRRQIETITGRIDSATGNIVAASEPFSVQRINLGQIRITFPNNFQLMSAVGMCHTGATGIYGAGVGQIDDQSTMFQLFTTTTGGSVDGIFSFIATGFRK